MGHGRNERQRGPSVTRTLVVTNDFPPRQGGIQTFVAALLATRPPGSVVVLASDAPGSAEHDAGLPYPVVRRRTGMLLPTPGVARAAAGVLADVGEHVELPGDALQQLPGSR